MKGRKEKIYSQGKTLDVFQIVRPSFRIGSEFQCVRSHDGIVRIANELDE